MPSNLAALVRSAARSRPHGLAVLHRARRLTWAEVDALVDAVAVGLLARGLVPGDRVAVLLGNSVEFVGCYFGALRAGLVVVPLNTTLTAHEVRLRLDDVDAALVVADPVTEPVAAEALGGRADADLVVVGTPDWDRLAGSGVAGAADAPDTDGIDAAGTNGDDTGGDESDAADAGERLAVLMFTSGTSGRPKPAMLTHRALLANLEQLLALDPPPMTGDDVVLLVLPLFHAYALNAGLGLAARTGATVLLVERFDPHDTLELVRDAGVTNIPGAPPMYVAWSAQPDLREQLSGVRLMVSGAAPLPAAVLEQFVTLTGRPVWEGYGMTETSPVITSVLGRPRPKPGAVGAPLPGIELSLRDDGGAEVDDGDPGEVWVRSPSLFSGYWPGGDGGPDDEGWFGTGDVGYLDEDGDLHLVDRRRELVQVSGFNVYPREVEATIEAHPDVAECAVIGVAHPYTGEAVKAYVVPRQGASLTAEAVLAHCQTRLARFKCPTIVAVVADLPHTSTGKVAKGRLRDAATAAAPVGGVDP